MKKQMKLFTYMTKPFVLFVLLFALGVGQMWGGNRRIYFDYSAVTMWPDASAEMKVHCWGGSVDGADYEMSAVEGESNLIYADINDGHTSLCFYRKNPNSNDWWTKTFDYDNIGSNNRFKIKNDTEKDNGIDKYRWADSGAAIRWNPGVCVDGLVDVHNPHTQAFSFTDNDGTYSVTLSAHTTYQFKILDGSTAYGLDNNVWTSSISNYTLNTSGYALRLCTAGAGTYTFAYNKSTHKISVTYPTVSHPNIDYCYLIDYTSTTWSNGVYIHFKDPSTSNSIAGTTWCGTQVTNKVEIGTGNYYFYYSPGDYPYFNLNEKGDGTDQTGDKSANWGRFLSWNECTVSAWDWCTFSVHIALDDRSAKTAVVPNAMDVAFNSEVLTDLSTVPQKDYYDFGGFYTGWNSTTNEVEGVQVIDETGHWIASVSDAAGVPYTDASKHWIHPGTSTTLYAKWTEHEYSLTINISPSGAGTVSPSPSVVTYETPTALLTATPSCSAYRFKEWQYSTGLGNKSGTGLDNTVQVTADRDATLTAVFEPKFYLVGVKYSTGEAGGGMPGWESGSEYRAPFIVTSTSPLTATCTRELDPNTSFKLLIRNRDNGNSYGYATPATNIGNNSLLMNTADGHVYMDTKGHGNYTFTISEVTEVDGVSYPTVSVSGPTSYQLTLKRAYVKVNGDWYKDVDDAGGTVSAQTTESGHNFAITDGQYVAQGGSIKYTATPTTPGFTFRGWYNSDYNYRISTENPYTSSNIQAAEHFEAKFTEDTIDVTIANDGHGYVQISGSTVTAAKVGVITTRTITAVAHPGYMFSHWTVPDGVNFNVANTTSATTTLNGLGSGSDGTLTAHFKPRYLLRGSLNNNESGNEAGMPGWSTTGGLEFTGTTSVEPSGTEPIPVNLTCTCTTLHPNKEYKFSVHDSVVNRNYGYATNLTDISSSSLLLNTENNNVKLYTAGYGTYVFQITYLSHDGNYYPTVKMLSRQASHTLTVGKNIDAGGSVSAQTNEGDGFAITNGQFYANGSDITFTASPNTGYYVEGWYQDAGCTTPYNGEDADVTIGDYNLTLTLSSVSQSKTVYAKFAKIWSVYLNLEHTYWSTYAKTDSKDIYTFVLPLPANTQYTFTINDNGAGSAYNIANNYYMDYGNHDNWDGFDTDKAYACGIKTAGQGDYTFTWNATDKKLSVSYPTSYTVTFGYGTGGSAVTATVEDATTITSGQYATNGKDITFTQTAATGYTFKGWYDAASGGSAISCMASDDVFDDIDADTSIYAQFTPNTYTVVYNANDASYYGSASGTTASSSHTYDEAKNLTSNGFSRAGFDFAGWNTAADGSGSSYTNGQSVTNLSATQDATVTLYARWTAHELTITLDDNGGSGGSPASLTAVYGRTAKADGGGMFDGITNPSRTGYTFGGWWTNTDGTGTEIITSAYYYHWTTDYVDNEGKWKYDGDVTAYAKWTPVALTFTGATDSDWGTASNWSPACVPTLGHDVTIQAPVVVAADHATAKSIVLDQNSNTGKLTIDANQGLEVVGTITRTTNGEDRLATRAEDLILESSSAGNASLVFTNSNSCAATVKMYSIGEIVSESQWNWQFMGTPFTSANALYSYYDSYLYEWNTSGDWDVVPNGGTMTPFTGYCITQSSPTTYVMDGTLNPNSDVNISIPAGKEFVMANSWTAPISVCNFTNTTLPLTTKTIYLFNTGYKPDPEDPAGEGTGAGTYIAMPINSAIYTGNYLIAPMQGFYVDNTNGSEATITLKYDELVRPSGSHTDIVAGPMHAPKRVAAEAEPDVMKIKATGSRYADRVVILAREDFSTGFDNGWDGKNLNEPGVAPILYALREDGTKDAVSAIPTYEGTVVGFLIGEDNNYTFSFNYDGEDIWYLNDLKEETSTLIDAANTYSFVAEAGDAEARFIISATPIQKLPTGIGNDANDAMVKVRKLIINDQLFIIRAGRMYNAVGSIVK